MSFASLGNCSCIALLPPVSGLMLPASPEGGRTRNDVRAALNVCSDLLFFTTAGVMSAHST
jgi:hypothetical protein